jgi:signal transduction histidine kinase
MLGPAVLWRLLAILLPAAVVTGGVVLAMYYQDLRSDQILYEQAAGLRADLDRDLVQREMRSVVSDLLYLAEQAVLADFLEGRASGRQQLEEEYVLFCRQRGVYDQIRYLDASGRERLRINYNGSRPAAVPEAELQDKGGRYYFAQALRLGRGDVFVSPFDLNVEHDTIERPLKPVIRMATPVFDRRGVKQGILILNYLGAALLDKLAEGAAEFPGSVWLLNRDGYFLRGPAPEEEWGFMLGHGRGFPSSFPEEWPRVSGSSGGQFRTARGLITFRVVSLHVGSPALPGDAGGLIVVAHVPPAVLEARAGVLLRRLLLVSGGVLVLVLVLAWFLAYAGAVRRDHERHLADSEARLRTLSARLLTAQEDERRSLSRDLHDELGQVVTSVTLDLQRAAQAADPGRKGELIGRALHGAGCLLGRLHEIAARLRPTLLDDLGLKDAVRSHLGEYERRTGIATRAEFHFEPVAVPPAVSENVFRILQEALTNVAKHAHSPEVCVGLRVGGGLVTLSVRDAGVGMAPDARDGRRLGILGMRERAELLGGTFALKPAPSGGVEVQVAIPIPKGG